MTIDDTPRPESFASYSGSESIIGPIFDPIAGFATSGVFVPGFPNPIAYSLATLEIADARTLSRRDVARLVNWLRREALVLEEAGGEGLAPGYRSRLMPEPVDDVDIRYVGPRPTPEEPA